MIYSELSKLNQGVTIMRILLIHQLHLIVRRNQPPILPEFTQKLSNEQPILRPLHASAVRLSFSELPHQAPPFAPKSPIPVGQALLELPFVNKLPSCQQPFPVGSRRLRPMAQDRAQVVRLVGVDDECVGAVTVLALNAGGDESRELLVRS